MQSERNFHSKTEREKIKLTKKTYRKASEQLLPNMRPLSYPNLTKTKKTYTGTYGA